MSEKKHPDRRRPQKPFGVAAGLWLPERGPVQRKVAGDQSLDSLVAKKCLEYVSRKHEYQLDRWVAPEVGYFERVTVSTCPISGNI